jgi:hypothetical protein
MRLSFSIPLIAIVLLLQNCKQSTSQNVDELIKVDMAFSAYSEQNGYGKAFIQFADSNAVLLRDNNSTIKGMEQLTVVFSATNDTSVILTWEPLEGFCSKSRDLGYTYGVYQLKTNDFNNKLLQTGHYVSIWKKNNRNEWKWVLDCGTQGIE